MPILRISSLPFENQDSSIWPARICDYFSRVTQIPLKHVSATWQLLPAGHYAHGGQKAHFQPFDSHPIIVEIMLPDFYSSSRVETVLLSAANAISHVTNMPTSNIFVQVNRARAGAVFDEGQVIHW